MTERERTKEEKIKNHCNALAEMVIAIRPIYTRAEAQQKAFIETTIGAALWYIPKPINAWTGYISKAALQLFAPDSGILKPKFSEEHVYPRKVAARLLLENESLNGLLMHELFTKKFGQLHYITSDENKAVIQFQRDSVFTRPEVAYSQAGIDLVLISTDDLRHIKKRNISVITKYINV